MRWKVDATEWDEMNTIWCQSTLKGMKSSKMLLILNLWHDRRVIHDLWWPDVHLYTMRFDGMVSSLFLIRGGGSTACTHRWNTAAGLGPWACEGGGCRGGRSSKMFLYVKIKGIQKPKRGFTSSINYVWFLDDLEFRSFWEYGLIHRHHVNGSAMTLSIYVTQERFCMIESAGYLTVAISATKWRMHTNWKDLV